MSMRLPAEQRRRQLLDVACDVFAASGFYGTSMDDIASTAGVTKPVLYQHFPSKRALYTELLEDVGARLLGDMTAATRRATTGRQRVEEGFGAYFRFVTNNRAAFRLLFGASARNDPEFAQIVDRVLTDAAEAISVLIEIDGTEEHRRALAHALVGIAESTSRHALTDPEASHDADELAHWVSELAWFGLRGVRPDAVAERAAGAAHAG
jgi:AcrR family transcriptional regulator